MSNVILPEPGEKETLTEYLKRLLDNRIINVSHVEAAIVKYQNSKNG